MTCPTRHKPTIKTVKFPLEYSDDKIQHPAAPPELGEHNSEFLKSMGHDEAKIAEFKDKGVI